MGSIKAKQGFAGLSLILAASNWFIFALDAWSRWGVLMSLPHVGILRFILNPLIAPILLFIGMFLLNQAQRQQYELEIGALSSAPKLIGVEQYQRAGKRSRWWYLLSVPAIATCVGLVIVSQLLFFPSLLPAQYPSPPTADPMAYVVPNEPSPQLLRPSIKQTLVDNHGTITGGQINGNFQIAGTDTPQKQTSIHVWKGFKGRTPDITGMHFCNGDAWKCFLNEEEFHAQRTDTADFDETIDSFRRLVDWRGQQMLMRGGTEETKQQCDQEFNDSVTLLREHIHNESATIKALRSNPPVCLK